MGLLPQFIWAYGNYMFSKQLRVYFLNNGKFSVALIIKISGSLRERRSEEMIQSNISSPRGSEVPFESQRG